MKSAAAASSYKFYDPSESDEVLQGAQAVSANSITTGDRLGHFQAMPDFVRGTSFELASFARVFLPWNFRGNRSVGSRDSVWPRANS